MDENTTIITPVIGDSDLYTGTKKEFEVTPPGTYRMALTANLRVKTSKSGNARLVGFFTHVDPAARGRYKGVEFGALLEGTDKNGKSNARQFGDMLQALGVAKEDILNGQAAVSLKSSLASIPADEQWKGIPAVITINGDVADLTGREANIVVVAQDRNGKVSYSASSIYAAN